MKLNCPFAELSLHVLRWIRQHVSRWVLGHFYCVDRGRLEVQDSCSRQESAALLREQLSLHEPDAQASAKLKRPEPVHVLPVEPETKQPWSNA